MHSPSVGQIKFTRPLISLVAAAFNTASVAHDNDQSHCDRVVGSVLADHYVDFSDHVTNAEVSQGT